MNTERLASAFVRRALLPLTPARRRLELLAWSNRNFEGVEPELAMLDRLVPRGCRTAIDAGANVGLYTLRLARLCHAVYAFEINPGVTGDLERAELPNVKVMHVGLSSVERSVVLYIPLLHGKMPLEGWASLTPGNCPDTDIHTEITGEVRTLDSYAIANVDFVKIDVEGHELELLKGARETLARYHPRILAEAKNLSPVAALLAPLGYRARRADDFGVTGSPPWMHVFERG
ncbi:MAG: FkbM family methyltransferase [Gammaproteobacteria bacterium]|nr:FkbM family methyltransferase [Gammaproteobacteria bacterium]MBV8403415.1 FkbM family methyltransferase [Gammaproteobacteria bacterium]